MRHAGEEFRLVLARDLELSALLLDLLKQPRVLYGKRRLHCKCPQQVHGPSREFPCGVSADDQAADESSLAHHRHREQGAHSGIDEVVTEPAFVCSLRGDVRHLNRFQCDRRPAQHAFSFANPRRASG